MNYGRQTLLNTRSVPSQAMPNVNQRGGVFGPQGYGGGIFDGMSGVGLPVGESSNGNGKYPWLSFSEATQSLQFATNVELRMRDMPEIGTDGVLGPETCGAQQYLEGEGLAEHAPPATCQAFQYPKAATDPAPEAPDAEEEEDVSAPGSSRAGMGAAGFLLIAGGVAAAGIYLATRKKGR